PLAPGALGAAHIFTRVVGPTPGPPRGPGGVARGSPLARPGQRAPVTSAVLGTMLLEQRGDELVALR
ncbi:hypothetical protein ACFWPB_18005, partial [Rhodococcus sp. NPDC058514]